MWPRALDPFTWRSLACEELVVGAYGAMGTSELSSRGSAPSMSLFQWHPGPTRVSRLGTGKAETSPRVPARPGKTGGGGRSGPGQAHRLLRRRSPRQGPQPSSPSTSPPSLRWPLAMLGDTALAVSLSFFRWQAIRHGFCTNLTDPGFYSELKHRAVS